MHPAAPPPSTVTLSDGRILAFDDVGDRDGHAVVYFHGTPDSRLARHPDDGIVAGLGLRLLAVDRPGIGASSPDPAATPVSVADDVAALLDAVDVDRVAVLSWSAGSIGAAAFAGLHPDRADGLTLIAPLLPADAYPAPSSGQLSTGQPSSGQLSSGQLSSGEAAAGQTAAVQTSGSPLDGAPDGRLLFADALAAGSSPDELAAELTPWLVPDVIDDATAVALLGGSHDDVSAIPGASEQLVRALQASVAQGTAGVARDIAAQATLLGPLLDTIGLPVTVHVGDRDIVCPPAMATWWAERLGGRLHVHPGCGHAVAFTAWLSILEVVAGNAGGGVTPSP